eukprot:7046426-Ditylum_brightwellii.AAC.1
MSRPKIMSYMPRCFSAINDAPAPESSRAISIIVLDLFFTVANTIGTIGSSVVFACGLRGPATLRTLTNFVLEKDRQ